MKRPLFVCISVLFLAWSAAAQGSLGYYRYPAIRGDTVVFAAEGDLWTVDRQGGIARRLTSHPGQETRPVLSPDGKTLAFSATYEGPTELYTIRLPGGVPTRWTFEAEASIAIGFAPDGRLLYSTTSLATLPDPEIVALDLETGGRERIPLAQASDGTYDDSGNTFFFARPRFHRNNTKRYQGGTARNIWRFSDGDTEATNLTADFAGGNHSPMWWDGRLYYVNDRDGTMNIWSMKPDGSNRRQHTRHSGWDVLSPSLADGRIVYQLGADLHLLDLGNDRDRKLEITLASDFDQLRERWVDDPMQYLTSAHLHPKGEAVVLTARGRVFVAPARSGRLVRSSTLEGVRYREAAFLDDGTVVALSDRSGELEWVKLPPNGIGAEEPLTSDATILRFGGVASPKGDRLAYTDQNQDLWLLEVRSGTQTRVSTNREGVGNLSWSPDGSWLAYTQSALNTFNQIFLFEAASGQRLEVTSDRVNSVSPAWSADGRFLYFLSDRNLQSLVGSPWGSRQPEPYFDRQYKLYEVALRPGQHSPFKPDDELKTGSDEKDDNSASVTVEITAEGLASRLREVPLEPGNYRNLSTNKEGLFFITRESGPGADNHLQALALEADAKPVTLVEAIRSYEMSANGAKLLIRKGQDFSIVDAKPGKISDLKKHRVNLSRWSFALDVRQDLRQLFVDAWRLERDYFWDPNMHGLDWDGVRDKYLPLVDRLTTRDELNDLIGQLVGELSALHVSVRGGDLRRGDDQIRVAALGARLARDETAGGYRIDYIYRSDPDYPDEISPLADPDLNLTVGDLIVSINGTSTLSVAHPNALLRNQQGRQVLLGIEPEHRQVVVTPTVAESGLRYRDWQYTRRLKVEQDGAGQIGYVHLRAMGSTNLTEWYRQFYPVFNRQGLIIDMRHNRGGNIDSLILEKLLRRAWFYWKGRVGTPYWNMNYAFRGHMVVLVDPQTASDGEAFAEGFRRLGLGKIIGTRTWGGEIWLSSNNRLTDGGLARAPQTGVYGPEGHWLIEGHGVDPDIVVDNLPHATFKGSDAQLDAAIAYLQKLIKEDPRGVPPPPAYPDKSFEYPRR